MKCRKCYVTMIVCLVLICSPLFAAVYEISVPCTGTYGPYTNNSRSCFFDFNKSFSQIQSLSIVWGGYCTGGMAWDSRYDHYLTMPGYLTAWITDPTDPHKPVSSPHVSSPTAGSETVYFNQVDIVDNWFRDWDFLLDGKAQLEVSFPANVGSPYLVYVAPGGAELYSAKLRIEGTLVPEPAAWFSLLLGFAGCVGIRRKVQP